MRRLGERLGIRVPSIYKHLPGKDALEAAMISDGFEEFCATLDGTTLDGLRRRPRVRRRASAPLPAHDRRPLDRELLVPGAEDRAALPGAPGRRRRPRCRAGPAGLRPRDDILELDGRFPLGADLDAGVVGGLRAFEAL